MKHKQERKPATEKVRTKLTKQTNEHPSQPAERYLKSDNEAIKQLKVIATESSDSFCYL